jgi:hypothetical protein
VAGLKRDHIKDRNILTLTTITIQVVEQANSLVNTKKLTTMENNTKDITRIKVQIKTTFPPNILVIL